jgi:hypothetical protein
VSGRRGLECCRRDPTEDDRLRRCFHSHQACRPLTNENLRRWERHRRAQVLASYTTLPHVRRSQRRQCRGGGRRRAAVCPSELQAASLTASGSTFFSPGAGHRLHRPPVFWRTNDPVNVWIGRTRICARLSSGRQRGRRPGACAGKRAIDGHAAACARRRQHAGHRTQADQSRGRHNERTTTTTTPPPAGRPTARTATKRLARPQTRLRRRHRRPPRAPFDCRPAASVSARLLDRARGPTLQQQSRQPYPPPPLALSQTVCRATRGIPLRLAG